MNSGEFQGRILKAMDALKLMDDYHEYARSLGCVIFDNEIHCGAVQAIQLMQWWRKRTIRFPQNDGGFL